MVQRRQFQQKEHMSYEKYLEKLMSVPYSHRGRDMSGLDCYGLIIIWYKRIFGIGLYDIEEEYDKNFSFKGKNYFIENYHKQWRVVCSASIHTVVLFHNSGGVVNHGGVMLDSNRFVHACRAGVVVSDLNIKSCKNKLNGFYQLKDASQIYT